MLDVLVVQGNQPCILGRDWLEKMKLNWENIFRIESEKQKGMDIPKAFKKMLDKKNGNKGL